MRLYATTTSERASKGQGGNDYLEIEIFVLDKVSPRYHVRVNGNRLELLDDQERTILITEHNGFMSEKEKTAEAITSHIQQQGE